MVLPSFVSLVTHIHSQLQKFKICKFATFLAGRVKMIVSIKRTNWEVTDQQGEVWSFITLLLELEGNLDIELKEQNPWQ